MPLSNFAVNPWQLRIDLYEMRTTGVRAPCSDVTSNVIVISNQNFECTLFWLCFTVKKSSC